MDLVSLIFVGAILFLYLLGFAWAYISAQSIVRDQFRSGTLEVVCSNCSGGERSSSQFSGFYAINFETVVSISGNGTRVYAFDRGTSAQWTVSWELQKNTVLGTLETKFTLSNGTVEFDRNTNLPYGSIIGSWNSS